MDGSTQRSFSFVNLKHPDDLKDEETQLRIRRLAMTEVGRARRKPKTKRARNEIVLEFRDPNTKQPDFDRLGGGNIDPFSAYPIPLDEATRALLGHIFAQDDTHPTSLRGSWYPVALSSPAAFHTMLANTHNFIFQKLNGYFPPQNDLAALAHYHKALRSASEMMKLPHMHDSDETIGAIAFFMGHHALHGIFVGDEWRKHSNALQKIVANRGGFDAIKGENLRITMSWADLLSTFAQDIPPQIPMPEKWVSNSKCPATMPRSYCPISLAWKRMLPLRLDWITIFDDVVQLISRDQAFSEEQLDLCMRSGCWVEATLWRLLSIRPLHLGSEDEHVMEEVCRLGTLLFLAPCWRQLGHSPVWTAALSRNLLSVLMKHMIEWKELKPLLAWTLFFAAVETRDLFERSRLVFMLSIIMGGLNIHDWGEFMQIVKGVLWVDHICTGTDDLIRDEVMATREQLTLRPVVAEESLSFWDNIEYN
ncbi:hypothetical protein DE146DRAFT_638973 [Phaeosphaeria sp. MPI-PUGE-AT-0046c]|nr:hypothetical protein DE146DRAFT_638973 [Phaeosphaeria sp. MPI-PUGE-AT-0046c]